MYLDFNFLRFLSEIKKILILGFYGLLDGRFWEAENLALVSGLISLIFHKDCIFTLGIMIFPPPKTCRPVTHRNQVSKFF
jgi:hypothetical protein